MRVLVIVVMAGCFADPSPPPTPLEPGGWALSITSCDEADRFGVWYEIAADGRAAGRGSGSPYLCDGQLDGVTMAELTGALNASEILYDAWSRCRSGDGAGVYSLEVVRLVDGAAWQMNEVRYSSFVDDPPLAALLATVHQRFSAFTCAGCPPELDPDECLDAVPGGARFCLGEDAQTCDGASAGVVVACPAQSLECDAALGWVPPIAWSLTTVTLTRGPTSLQLDWTMQVENRGAEDFLTTSTPSYWQLEDPAAPDGFAIPLDPASCAISAGPGMERAPPGSSESYTLTATCPPSAEIASASALEFHLRERPYDGAPFLPAVPVTIIDEMP